MLQNKIQPLLESLAPEWKEKSQVTGYRWANLEVRKKRNQGEYQDSSGGNRIYEKCRDHGGEN